jgi:hypothetical protein
MSAPKSQRGKRTSKLRSVLLLENDLRAGELRAQMLNIEQPHDERFMVDVAKDEKEAINLINKKRFEFLLVDLLLKEGSSASIQTIITDEIVDDSMNGSKVAKRLLEYHRKIHREKPTAPRRLRTVIYSGAVLPRGYEGQRLKVKLLCDGAHEVVSCAPQEMKNVLRSLTDMCELEREMKETISGQNWIGKIVKHLGCGISIIGRNWKIWYCSPRNARFSGYDLNTFHDQVCWREYHDFRGLFCPCPGCPAATVMTKSRQVYDCDGLMSLKMDVKGAGTRSLSSSENCRLLPVRDGELKWVYVIASPILSKDKRLLGAVETVVDMNKQYEAFHSVKMLRGDTKIEDRVKPALRIVQWLGYRRVRLFNLSEDGKDVVGVAQLGDGLRMKCFEGHRFSSSQSAISLSATPSAQDFIIRSGPGFEADVFGKEHCKEYVEFVLRDMSNRNSPGAPIGTLVIDDVKEAGAECNRIYEREDIERLKPVADYVANVLTAYRKMRRDQAFIRYAQSLRSLESFLDKKPAAPVDMSVEKQAQKLQKALIGKLTTIFKKEPYCKGFHARFVSGDGGLNVFGGFGPYSQFARPVKLQDQSSLSARCINEKRFLLVDVKEELCPSFEEFKARTPETSNQRAWCNNIRVLGCSPILWGNIEIGALAIQAEAPDFFSPDAKQFVKDICNIIARVLGPIQQEYDYYTFWENAAYAFRGPASILCDSIERQWLFERDQTKIEDHERRLALAKFLFIKADTFHFETGQTGEMTPERTIESLPALWKRWCAIFSGFIHCGRKTVNLELPNDQTISEFSNFDINSDIQLLTEIIFNVFENAWKACKKMIRIGAQIDDGHLIIRFEDDGDGIRDEAYAYMRADPISGNRRFHLTFETGAIKGSGLGWKWSKRHADMLDVRLIPFQKGTLTGATIEVRIPITKSM